MTPDFTHPMRRVAVIGCGVVGGAIAIAALEAGLDVVVYDVDARTMDLARERGLATAATPGGAARERDLVLIATPVDQIGVVAPMIKPYLSPDTVVTEIGSVKNATRGLVEALASERISVVPSHPMAGSELFGFENADVALLKNCTWLVCPTESGRGASRLAAFATQIGAGRVLACELDAHDLVVGVVSHLPQLSSVLLAATIGSAERSFANGALEAAGGGFRDTTRIADSSITMWGPVISGNRMMLAALLEELVERTSELADALRRDDTEYVSDLFRDARLTRDRWREAISVTATTQETLEEDTARWSDPDSGEEVWIDRSFGWETIRTSAEDPHLHAVLSARYLGMLLNVNVEDIKEGGAHHRAVVDAVCKAGGDVQARETWTADGLAVNGVVMEDRFIVIT